MSAAAPPPTLALQRPLPRLEVVRAQARRYLLAIVVMLTALGVRGVLTPAIGDLFPFATFYLALLVTTWFAGPGPGVLSLLLAVVFTSLFWLEPVGAVHVTTVGDVIGLAYAGGVGLAIVVAVDAARRSDARTREARKAAELYASRVTRLQQLTTEVSAVADLGAVTDVVKRHGAAMLGAARALVTTAEAPRIPPAMQCAIRGGRAYLLESLGAEEPARDGTGGVLAAPLLHDGRAAGALAFEFPRRHVGREELELVTSIADECALAMDRARLFEAERAARTRAERAVAAHKELLAIVSHDLRSPLGTLLLGLERIARSGHPDIERPAALMKRAGERMQALISDLLDAASVEAGALRVRSEDRLAVSALLDEAVELARPAARQRQLTLAVRIDGDATIQCDRHRLLQVLGNLLGNAIRLTPEGGAVTLRATPRSDEIEIAVSDTGPGIAAEQLAHLFTRHFRGDRATAGAGLGLYITKGIVEAHGGRIVVESTPGHGATFRFTIPRRSSEVADVLSSAPSE